jgi:hypothetical protein
MVMRVATARAGGVVVPPAHGEPDVADEADAFTLVVRAALEHGDAPAQPTPLRLADAASAAARAHADWVIFAEVARHGTGLSAALLIVRATGEVAGAAQVEAGDADLHGLATQAIAQIVAVTGGPPPSVRPAALGELRPFVRAQRAAALGQLADAGAALATAEPQVALRVPTAAAGLAPGWIDASQPLEVRVRAALAAATPRELGELAATGTGPVERAARAFAALATSDATRAERELAGAPTHPLILRARVVLAEIRNDRPARDAALRGLLAAGSDDALIALAGVARGSITEAMYRRALELAAHTSPRLASITGFAAAAARVDGPRALALITVAELDDLDAASVPQVLADLGAADSVEGARLTAELAVRRDPASAGPAIAAFLRAAPDDPRAHVLNGRALMSSDPRAAARELARGDRPREQGRALLRAGDLAAAGPLLRAGGRPETTEDALVAARQVLVTDPATAVTVLRVAAERAPASTAIRIALAEALERTGDAAGAAALRAIPVPLSDDEPATATAHVALAPTATSAPTAARTTLAGDALAPLLAALPSLRALAHRTVVLVPLLGSGGGLFALHHTDELALRRALADALAAPPYELAVSGHSVAALDEPLRAADLEPIAAADRAAAIVLYRITPDGGSAAVKLVLFTPGATDVLEVERTIDGAGLTSLNLDLIWFGLGLLLIAILAVVVWTIRGRSELEVRIKTDPAGKNETFCIELSRTSARPSVTDPVAFRAQQAATGQVVKARGATLVGKSTRFRIAPGQWYVHLYGVYDRGGDTRTLGPTCSQEVTLARGRSAPVTFDLVPDAAEVRVTIYDAQRARVALWLDGRDHDKVFTNDQGEAVLFAPVGSHTLKIEARGLLLEQPLTITSPKIERLQINLERERRLAEVSGGLSLRRAPAGHTGAEQEFQMRASPDAATVEVAAPVASAPAAPVASAPVAPAASAPTAPAAVVASAATMPMGTPPVVSAATTLVLGRYQLVGELGRGAMGVVYRARDTNLEREIALKAMSPELRAHPVALTLFAQEAKALAQLNHPNIVAVYDQATESGDTYMMMELVEGTTLEAVLAERGAVPWRQALGVIDQLCAGLAYAHARKVIHRDIKPGNVFVTRDGRVKLGDFGLARVMRELAIRRTEIRGTPLYMAPEQIIGENVGPRADLYAVGCTLFELVTGAPPFVDGDILYHQMNTPPPRPSTARPELPASFDALVLACLAKDPAARIASADDIRAQLRVVLQAP